MGERALYEIDLAFARLELLELEHGKRTLTQCPGLKAMAAHIAKAEGARDARLKTCTCPKRATARGLVHENRDTLCPLHGDV